MKIVFNPNDSIRQKALIAAMSLIRHNVERGHSIDAIIDSLFGEANDSYFAHIGGYAACKKVPFDCIVVTRIEGQDIKPEIFKVKFIYDKIVSSKSQLTLFG